MNQQARFKTLENKAGDASFTIPAEDVPASWDLMYYFEILNAGGTGWFQPDPYVATPYYVVKVQPAVWPHVQDELLAIVPATCVP